MIFRRSIGVQMNIFTRASENDKQHAKWMLNSVDSRRDDEKMNLLIGADVGTEGTKVIAVDGSGHIRASAYHTYQFQVPRSGWTEQDPSVWWNAVVKGLQSLWEQGIQAKDIKGVGIGGQMHSSVCLDSKGECVYPSILWNDTRTKSICDEVLRTVGAETYQRETGNSLLPGFTLGKLLWMKENQPVVFSKISSVLMPKDYINFQLTGELSADVTDASGTGVFNVRERTWNTRLMDELGISSSWFPHAYESQDIVGRITPEAASRTGLLEGTPVVAGAGDNPAAAIGLGVVEDGHGMISVGTSGVVFCPLTQAPTADVAAKQNPTLHVFCHAQPGLWYGMGVTLAAGASLRWYRDAFADGNRSYDDLMHLAQQVPAGSDGLLYFPYLTGERTPLNSDVVRGGFLGVDMVHREAHFVRSVAEGVSYSLRDCLELIRPLSDGLADMTVTGGIVHSPIWLQILTDVIHQGIRVPDNATGAAYGAALLAGVGAGMWTNPAQIASNATAFPVECTPSEDAQTYRRQYGVYETLAKRLVEPIIH